MTALVPPPRPIGAESTSLRTSGPLRRNGAMKMEWATTTQWPPCSGASVGTAQRSLSYRCRRSTRHRTRTRPFRLPSRHASSFDHTSGTWHISENFLAGLGRKVDCSGIDDMLTNAGVFSSATATAGNFVRAKDRAASRAWNLWAESQVRFAWEHYVSTMTSACENVGDVAAATIRQRDLAKRFVSLTPTNADVMPEADQEEAVAGFEKWVTTRKAQSKMFEWHWGNLEAYWSYTRHKAATRFISHLGHREFVDSLTSMLPVLCAFDRPVCARFVAAFARQMAALECEPHFANIREAAARDGCGLTVQETDAPGSALAYDFCLENGLHRLAKMDQGLRLGMSSAATVHTFFAGLPERFYFLKALKGLENCDSPLSPELNDMQLHHPFSKLCPT
mmetsp:Transcript_32062/g.96533  ORF Transcript_32062/g.96533 Transcript_32062/m.96533 type:complete len:393 (+) Transcript_32062:2528-3706(+)